MPVPRAADRPWEVPRPARGPCHDVVAEGGQDLLNDASRAWPNLAAHSAGTQAGALIVDEGEKREDGGQLARGDDRVAAIEAAPERCGHGVPADAKGLE
jgi:hypothetical protein